MTFAVAAAVASGVQAVSSIRQGQFQKAQMNIQAKAAELEGRQNALNYMKQGLAVLETQRRMNATIIARGASGGIDPFSGSPMTVAAYNAFKAGEEYNLGIENAGTAIAGGLAKSQSLKAAGDFAMKQAYLSAAMSIAQGAMMYSKLSVPGAEAGAGSNIGNIGQGQGLGGAGASSGYGFGQAGYGAGYGISPFGEQAQMLSAQW